MIEKFNMKLSDRIFLLPPLGLKESLFLWKDASLVMTDSGGLQEETTALGIPCFTIRNNTERPITITESMNILAGQKRGLSVPLSALKTDSGKRAKCLNISKKNYRNHRIRFLLKALFGKI